MIFYADRNGKTVFSKVMFLKMINLLLFKVVSY